MGHASSQLSEGRHLSGVNQLILNHLKFAGSSSTRFSRVCVHSSMASRDRFSSEIIWLKESESYRFHRGSG